MSCATCGLDAKQRCEGCGEPVCWRCVQHSEPAGDPRYPDMVWCCSDDYHENAAASEPQRTFLR